VLIDFIVDAAHAAGETAADYMVNRLVEVHDDATVTATELPPT
jgi:hypothetical protein